MNVCRFRNRMANYCDYVTTGDDKKLLSENETDLQSVVFWTFMAMFVTVVMVWWVIPLRKISNKITSKKFRCDKV